MGIILMEAADTEKAVKGIPKAQSDGHGRFLQPAKEVRGSYGCWLL